MTILQPLNSFLTRGGLLKFSEEKDQDFETVKLEQQV